MIAPLLLLCCGGLLMGSSVAEDSFSGESTLMFQPTYSKLLKNAKELEELKASPSVGTVYFYFKETYEWTEDFLKMFDKSAGFLNAYGLSLGLVDCSGGVPEDLKEECRAAMVEHVYTFRKGVKLLELEVATMFDVDSIMSNVLLLALMEEVTIAQDRATRQKLEHDNAGQKDIIFAYHNAVGTYEHRIFMEIAYAYQDKYKFVMSSEIVTTYDMQDSDQFSEESPCAMWILYCKDRYDAAHGCRSVNYRGRLTLIDLASFFKQLSWPKVLYRKKGSDEKHPCEINDSGCVIIQHSPKFKEDAEYIVDSLKFDLHAIIGLIVEHIDGKEGEVDPLVTILKPGGEKVPLEGGFDLEVIERVTADHLLPDPLSAPPKKKQKPPPEQADDTSDPSKIDDQVVQVAFQQRLMINHIIKIPALTDKTFPELAKGKDNKLLVVLFYLPFDAQGMVFLRPFQQAGDELAAMKGDDPTAHPLARVNCFDWTDVCQKENIVTYPVIHIYRNGGKREQYMHALDSNVLVRTVMLLQAEQPLMLKSTEEVTKFLDGQLPSQAYSTVDNLVLLKLTKSKKEMEAYKAVAKELETQMLFAIVGPDVKTSDIPNGGVLHKRPRDPIRPVETMTENLDAASMIDFLKRGQFDVFPELTFLNFPALYARKQPFAILFHSPSVPAANEMQQTIVSHLQSGKDTHNMIFCKMTVDVNPDAEFVLQNYTKSKEVPAFTVVNHNKGEIFILQGKEMKTDTLLPWIKAVENGDIVPSKMLAKGEWKPPGRHYDFLALMDQAKKAKAESEKPSDADTLAKEEQQEANLAQDVETRAQLLDLQKSRLYSGKDRKTTPTKHSEL